MISEPMLRRFGTGTRNAEMPMRRRLLDRFSLGALSADGFFS
jgi:hypothetical protein